MGVVFLLKFICCGNSSRGQLKVVGIHMHLEATSINQSIILLFTWITITKPKYIWVSTDNADNMCALLPYHVFFWGYKLKIINCKKEQNNSHLMRTYTKLKGHQEIILVWNLTFHITIELQQVITRPLICHTKSNSLRTSCLGSWEFVAIQSLIVQQGIPHTTWCLFSIGHWRTLKTKSFLWCQII